MDETLLWHHTVSFGCQTVREEQKNSLISELQMNG